MHNAPTLVEAAVEQQDTLVMAARDPTPLAENQVVPRDWIEHCGVAASFLTINGTSHHFMVHYLLAVSG